MKENEELRRNGDDNGSSSAVLQEKERRIADLTDQVETLTQRLQANEADANAVAEQWQGYYSELEAKLEAVTKKGKRKTKLAKSMAKTPDSKSRYRRRTA